MIQPTTPPPSASTPGAFTVVPGPSAARPRPPRFGRHFQENAAGWVFLAPFLVLLLAFVAWPLLNAFWLSFHAYDLFAPPRWVGLKNYQYLLGQADFWISLRNTSLYAFGVVGAQTALALGLALLLDRRIRGKAFFRVATFLPSVTSSVAISLIFMVLFFRNGMLNQALAATHLDVVLGWMGLKAPVDWLGNPATALPAIMIQSIWMSAGYYMIIFLAGLQDIPEVLYEAASVDGATPAQQFWALTLPLLRPTTFYVATIGLIGGFQVFDQVYVMTEGGPLKATLTTAYLLYQEAFMNFHMGYACAIAFVLATVIFAFTAIQKKFLGDDA